MSLSKEAILVTVAITRWDARKYEKQVDTMVDMRFGSHEAGRFVKKFIDQPELRAIRNLAQRAREYHYKNTLPWDDKVWRILPIEDFAKYSEMVRDYRGQFFHSVETFLGAYRYIIGKEEQRLGELFNEDDYPTADTVRKKFKFSTGVRPIPERGDIRVDATKEEIAEMQELMSQEANRQQQRATMDMHKRLYDTVQNINKILGADNRKIRETLIERAVEMCKQLEHMNSIIRDKEVERMTKEVEKELSKFTPETLRTDKSMRHAAIAATSNIMNKMSEFMG